MWVLGFWLFWLFWVVPVGLGCFWLFWVCVLLGALTALSWVGFTWVWVKLVECFFGFCLFDACVVVWFTWFCEFGCFLCGLVVFWILMFPAYFAVAVCFAYVCCFSGFWCFLFCGFWCNGMVWCRWYCGCFAICSFGVLLLVVTLWSVVLVLRCLVLALGVFDLFMVVDFTLGVCLLCCVRFVC